jgi:hypothetical protein
MIATLGIAVSGDRRLMDGMRRVLETLARNQSSHGHIPSLVHDKDDRGASDTTPLFLLAVAVYRRAAGRKRFLEPAVRRALTWMEYQSTTDRYLVAQQPTSDWRDEQWVMGNALFVNSLLYGCLHLLGQRDRAHALKEEFHHLTATGGRTLRHVPEGLVTRGKSYYALWSYKVYSSDRFDLLGNSLAILFGLASPHRAAAIVNWVERQCAHMRRDGDLSLRLPPNFFPFIRPGDPDWRPRYERFNKPGEYHNGGIWPFVCGFYVAALVAAGRHKLAQSKLAALTGLVRPARTRRLAYGFNEWFKAQDGKPMGQDWQTWSAAMYLYAAKCVETRSTPFFEEMRASTPASETA